MFDGAKPRDLQFSGSYVETRYAGSTLISWDLPR